jgi:hypothetical protein
MTYRILINEMYELPFLLVGPYKIILMCFSICIEVNFGVKVDTPLSNPDPLGFATVLSFPSFCIFFPPSCTLGDQLNLLTRLQTNSEVQLADTVLWFVHVQGREVGESFFVEFERALQMPIYEFQNKIYGLYRPSLVVVLVEVVDLLVAIVL